MSSSLVGAIVATGKIAMAERSTRTVPRPDEDLFKSPIHAADHLRVTTYEEEARPS